MISAKRCFEFDCRVHSLRAIVAFIVLEVFNSNNLFLKAKQLSLIERLYMFTIIFLKFFKNVFKIALKLPLAVLASKDGDNLRG